MIILYNSLIGLLIRILNIIFKTKLFLILFYFDIISRISFEKVIWTFLAFGTVRMILIISNFNSIIVRFPLLQLFR